MKNETKRIAILKFMGLQSKICVFIKDGDIGD